MSLLSLGQQLFDGARQLFDGLQKPVDGQQQQQPSAWQRFGIFNFSGNALTRNNEHLRNLSATAAISDVPAPTNKSDESFVVRVKKNPPDPREITDQIIKQVGFTAPDIEAYKAKHGGADPRTDVYNIINRCIIDPRCEKVGLENIPQPKPDGTQPSYKITVEIIPRSVTEPLRDFLKTERAAQKAEYQEKLQKLKDNSTGLIAKDTAAQVGKTIKENAPTLLTTAAAGGLGTAANLVLRPPLELPQISEMVKNMRVVIGSAATVAEFAPPVLMVAPAIAGAKATIEQYLGGQASDKLTDIANRNRDRILAIPLPPLTMTMDDAPPIPQGKPTDTAERPTQPNAQPIPDEADLPKGGLEVKPQAQPPSGNQPTQSPKNIDPRLVPPTIIGGTALAKLTIDKLSEGEKAELQKAGHTLPSLPSDPNRIPNGKRTLTEAKDDPATVRSIQRENESAEILAKAGFHVEQNFRVTEQDRIDNPWLDPNKNPDYKIEGKIFDNIAPSSPRAFNFLEKIEKKVDGQARRIILNMDDSPVTPEELKKVLTDNPINDLEEVIIIKGGQVTYFYPFK